MIQSRRVQMVQILAEELVAYKHVPWCMSSRWAVLWFDANEKLSDVWTRSI